jgi:hypothetical protein
MESDVHKEYVALRPKNLRTVGELLGRHGLEFDRLLNSMVRDSMSAAQGSPPLAIYCAEALIWTRHAQRGDGFMRAACDYLINGTSEALELATEAAWRFGPETLGNALQAFRELLADAGISDLPVSIPELQRLQGECMNLVATAKDNHRMRGLGPWLFLAPFKIHITYHPELWDDQDLDAATMPLGMAVGRSLKELMRGEIIAKGAVPEIDEDDYLTSGQAFLDALADVVLWQEQQRLLAEAGSSRVHHINSGLYEMGYKGN